MITILYNKRSCETAKNLAAALSSSGRSGVITKRLASRYVGNRELPNFTIRWGNSSDNSNGIELNSKEAVKKAADKLAMIKCLIDAGIPTPKVHLTPTNIENGFYRNEYDHVSKRSRWVEGDKYVMEDFNKVKEFRVHIFDGKTIGVYEKVPNDGNYSGLLKSDNCAFKRIDQNIVMRGVRPIAKKAVEALGLLFGGVDVMVDSNGTIVVNEVNSSPGLNTLNIDRWVEVIKEYVLRNNTSNNTTQSAT